MEKNSGGGRYDNTRLASFKDFQRYSAGTVNKGGWVEKKGKRNGGTSDWGEDHDGAVTAVGTLLDIQRRAKRAGTKREEIIRGLEKQWGGSSEIITNARGGAPIKLTLKSSRGLETTDSTEKGQREEKPKAGRSS